MIHQAIRKLLTESVEVTNLVGDRIYYVERPQIFDLPAVAITVGITEKVSGLSDSMATYKGSLEITALASTYTAVHDITQAIESLLSGSTAIVEVIDKDQAAVNVEIQRFLHDDSIDLKTDHRNGDGQIRTHARQAGFRFTYIIKPTA